MAFTGSVAGGHAVQRAAADRFIATGLELGGCDPAYVRDDANLAHAVESLVDGAFFNSGQSCCGIQRIYVHQRVYDDFVAGAVALTNRYVLGDPTSPDTTLGPVVRTAAAEQIRRQIAASIAAGAIPAIDETSFAKSAAGTPYLAPQLLLGVDHRMPVMREEIFGPVAGIMKVAGDEEARALMNDSDFGLTAAVWTADVEAGRCARRPDRDGHLLRESLRLSRPGAGLGRRQGFRPRLHAFARRLRAPDTTEVLPPAAQDLKKRESRWNSRATGTIRRPSASARAAYASCPMPAAASACGARCW